MILLHVTSILHMAISGPSLETRPPDPLELAELMEGDLFEGDIKIGKNTRNAIRDATMKWHNATIPFNISSAFNNDEMKVIAQGMKDFHEKTCLRFVPRTSERDYIEIISAD